MRSRRSSTAAASGDAASAPTLESHEDLEQLLPVSSWRGWLIAACGVMLVAAALLYASTASRLVTVPGIGRATDPNGIRLVSATVAGQMDDYLVKPGERVTDGQIVAYVMTGDSRVPQRTQNSGTVLEDVVRPGDPVQVGDWILEIASTETDGERVIVSFSLEDGQRLQVGQPATVTSSGTIAQPNALTVEGTVSAISDPLLPSDVEVGLALREPPEDQQIVAEITLDEPVGPGALVTAEVTVSERNLLQQLLGLS
jgi:biotin carboxyl carrier protein